jgi:hypothetical protein
MATRTRAKTTREKPKPGTGALVAQPHGGRIWRGAPANPVAGPGRPSSEIKKVLRAALEERIPLVLEIVDARVPLREKCPKCKHEPTPTELEAKPPTHDDRLRGFEFLAKHGLENENGIPSAEIRRRLTRTIEVIQEILAPKDAHLLIAALRPVWG